MGIKRYCDNCGDDELPGRPIYQAQAIIRSLPGRLKTSGMRVGPVTGIKVDVTDPRSGLIVESDQNYLETDTAIPPSDVYFLGNRDLCFKCMQGAADKIKDQVKGDGRGYFPEIQNHGSTSKCINADARTSQTLVQTPGGDIITAEEADKRKATKEKEPGSGFTDYDKMPDSARAEIDKRNDPDTDQTSPEIKVQPSSGDDPDSGGSPAMVASGQPDESQ